MNRYAGAVDRGALIEKAGRVVDRLGVQRAALKVRRVAGHAHGMALSLPIGGAQVTRNFGALVQWLEDLARNHERGIEHLGDALHGDGVALVRAGEPGAGGTRGEQRGVNLYQGEMSPAEAWALVRRSAARLELPSSGIWLGRDGGAAVIRLELGPGRIVEKRSALQRGARENAAALALWMQCRARHFERGIDRDLTRVMSAYLLPGSG
jgi:hypothetical protein